MTITTNNIQIVAVAVAETLKQLQENNIINSSSFGTDNRELLSVKDIIALYPNLSESLLREAINKKRLKYLDMGKRGSRCLIDRKDLEEFLESQKQEETPISSPLDKYKQVNISGIINKAV